MSIVLLDIVHTYGEAGTKGVPAHTFFFHRVQPKNIPPATMVLVEKEWMRLRHEFRDEKVVPFFESATPDGVAVHAAPYRVAVVFNRNVLRPKHIEPLYTAYHLEMLGQLILVLTVEGTLVFAKKTNQRNQFSGFGTVIDMIKHHEKQFPLHTMVAESLEHEAGRLADVTNIRALGVIRFDQGFRRGIDLAVIAESRFSEAEWSERFSASDQFSRELLFVEPTADALIEKVNEVEQSAGRFSPSAIATCYLLLKAYYGEGEAERFREAMHDHKYPLGYE